MDPATVALLIKGLDLAFVAVNAWGRYGEAKAQTDPVLAQVRELRERVLVGDLSVEEAGRGFDALIQLIAVPRKAAMGRL